MTKLTLTLTLTLKSKQSSLVPCNWLESKPRLAGNYSWLLCVCLLAGLEHDILLAVLKSFPSLSPNSGKYQVGRYSTDCINVSVPLVVAPIRVAMDMAPSAQIITSLFYLPCSTRSQAHAFLMTIIMCNNKLLT